MQNICPHCHSPIPADAPGGLCPACVLLGVAGPTNPSQFHAAAAPTIEEVAAAFPELEVLEILGQGGMGVVFKTRQPRLDRLVALKILPPALAAQPGFSERFTREARVLARLAHPHIVGIYDFGESAGFFYLIMEFVNGVNLRAAMRAGVKPEQALLLVPKICEALQFAHDHGVLHRDIKPENILLDTTGTPKLADFGIAKLAGEEALRTGLTASGATLGTAVYMAPEQVEKPATVDHRADIYSLGVVLYEMLTGELPLGRFGAPSEKSTVNRGVDEVVMRALEKERERRQQSATAMKTEVEHATRSSAPPVVPQSAFGVGDPRITKILGILCALSAVGIPVAGILRTSTLSPGQMFAFTILFGALTGLSKWFEPASGQNVKPRIVADPAQNPWPKRVFLLLAALIVVPAVLIGVGLIVPMIFAHRSREMLAATRSQEMRERSAANEAGMRAAIQDEAIRVARERLKTTRRQVENGVAPKIEQAAAERDLAIAEARDDQVKVAEAQVAYAELHLSLLKANAQAGNVSASDVLDAEQALNNGRLQLEAARRKSRDARGTRLELPAAAQPAAR